ncbi:hypothetical protein EYF80_062279 [Liparis tanakae]|uniref:Uncharacterized protein n=1 Tax=Liparis tanakae TaxID=230148 RepID=A0A4Z2EFC2_9TELE|nr:hypothetical protein EYF80_062279 [Liparis tanakae]
MDLFLSSGYLSDVVASATARTRAKKRSAAKRAGSPPPDNARKPRRVGAPVQLTDVADGQHAAASFLLPDDDVLLGRLQLLPFPATQQQQQLNNSTLCTPPSV